MRIIKHLLVITAALTFSPSMVNGQEITIESLSKNGLRPIPTEELKQIIVGNTLVHTSLSGQNIPMYYRTDGKRVFSMGARRFEGPYTIRDDRRCESSSQGGEVCMTIYKTKPTQYVVCDPRDGGRCIWTMEVEAGNSRGIQ